MADPYLPGDPVALRSEWFVNDVLTDPTEIRFELVGPDGQIYAIDAYPNGGIVRLGAGSFRRDVRVTDAGLGSKNLSGFATWRAFWTARFSNGDVKQKFWTFTTKRPDFVPAVQL